MLLAARSAVLACAVLALGACGGPEADQGGGGGPTAEVSSADAAGRPDPRCTAVITDEVVGLLGWAEAGTPAEVAGRCEREGDGGVVTVGVDPTVAAGTEPSRLQVAYDVACQGLAASGESLERELDPVWLDGVTACVSGPREGVGAGFFEFWTVTDDGRLVQGQLAQSAEVATGSVRAAMALLVTGAQATDWE